MKKVAYTLFGCIVFLSACNHATENKESETIKDEVPQVAPPPPPLEVKTDFILAHIKTNKGEIICDLEFEKTPLTVANFMGLAEGKIKNDSKAMGKPFYDGLTFHRVITDFMIQGGDPMGTGQGGPGYDFPDEFDQSLQFVGPGVLAMANAGPNTNGCQFFITHKETPWLNGKHSIFGHVTQGQDIVNKIAQGDIIQSITFERKGEKATAFDEVATFNSKMKDALKAAAEAKKAGISSPDDVPEFIAWVKTNYPKAKKVGAMYILESKHGNGKIPSKGQAISVHYTGTLINGKKFDSSLDRGAPFEFNVGMGRVIQGWDVAFSNLTVGTKAKLLIPYTWAYGPDGSPPSIPGKATLIFDVELLAIK